MTVVKICPRCGGEFQRWVERCPDCDVDLELGEPGAPPRRAAEELPPARELACVRVGNPWQLREFATFLQERGLSCRIDSHPPDRPLSGGDPLRRGGLFGGAGTKLGLYVRPDDLDESRELYTEFVGGGGGAEFEAEGGAGEGACPACGEPVADDAATCASCGLAFQEAPLECGQCGAPVGPEDERCPSCDAPVHDEDEG